MARAATVRKLDKMLTLQEALDNPKLLRGLKKECFTCDPWNPVSVPRETCPTCKGSGFEDMAIVRIAREMAKQNKASNAKKPKRETYYDED